MDRLTGVLEALLLVSQEDPRVNTQFEAPEFDGSGDVEYFVKQFTEVAEANQWPA